MPETTVSITIPIDHPELDRILRLAREVAPVQTGDDRSEVLERLLAAGLNEAEQRFLLRLADAAPEVVAYTDLLELAGSPQKLGNITSGLFRRWRARGGTDENAPWTDVPDIGRQMTVEDAVVVRATLTQTGEV